MRIVLALLAAGVVLWAGSRWWSGQAIERRGAPMNGKVEKTEAQWREQLTPEQFEVTRRKGTERLHRRILGYQDARHVPVCLLRAAAL